MKKIIVALAAASLLFASCSGDSCKCTTKTYNGSGEKVTEVTATTPKPDDKSCSDVAKAGSKDLGDLGRIVVSCKTVNAD